MMTRYIDADELIRKLKERYDALVDAYDIWDAYTQGFCEALDTVEDISNETPVADVQKVKHGKWIKLNRNRPLYSNTFECSKCRRTITVGEGYEKFTLLKRYPYCHCGAKMEDVRMDGDER